MSMTFLIVEDDDDIFELVSANVRGLGYEAERAADGAEGLEKALTGNYCLIILDVMMPKLDGMEVCQRIRQTNTSVPILMLTARDQEVDRVMGLEFGADDYLTKPFSIPELRARIKALMRRMSRSTSLSESKDDTVEETPPVIVHAELVIDTIKQKVTKQGEVVALTPKEFDLLVFLAQRPGVPFSRSALLARVWGYDVAAYENNVNSHVNRLRSKLEDNPAEPRFIRTVRGVGYRFAEPEELL